MGVATHLFGESWTFPATAGAYLTNPSGDTLLFVAKFDTVGGLAYATFLGPETGDVGLLQYESDLDVDPAGNAYVAGVASATTYPTTPGAFQVARRGFSDLFVSKLDPSGSQLVYSTLFGGSQAEYPNGEPGVRIAVNAAGNAYIAALSDSADLPQKDAFATTPHTFIAKLDPDGSGLEYASYVSFQAFGVDALALAPSPAGASGGSAGGAIGAPAVYLAGPGADPRGLAVVGIDESRAPATCAGDCNVDGVVQVNELIIGVRIALGQSPVTECSGFDENGDGQVVVSELVKAVGALLGGCR